MTSLITAKKEADRRQQQRLDAAIVGAEKA